MMSSLSMVEAKLPPGFRFHPTDDELVCDYLLLKWNASHSPLLIEVDLNKCEPWDLPERACIGGKEWYFYSQRDRKYATGLRTNRATVSGYWKATGKDRAVVRRGNMVGMRKTLVFYQGRAPKGHKTQWVMHEFRLEPPFVPNNLIPSPSKEDWVLCRVFFKSKDGPARSSSGTENHERNNNNKMIDEVTGSSSVAMDNYIRFDDTTQANANAYQQVPCFSMFSDNQINHNHNHNHNRNHNHNNNNNNPTTSTSMVFHHNNMMMMMMAEDNNNNNNINGLGLGPNGNNKGSPNPNPSPSPSPGPSPIVACDKKVLQAVLNELTKMEGNAINGSPSIGEAGSSESYLSEVGLQQPSLWSPF